MDIQKPLARYVSKYKAKRFRKKLRHVLEFPGINCTNDPLIFVSQIRSGDIIPYLVAIYSMYRTFNHGRVVIVGDGLSDNDRRFLSSRIRGVEIRSTEQVDLKGLQKGGTWERLVTLLEMSKQGYTIQVDSDLVAMEPLSEVLDLVKDNRAFALGNRTNPGCVTLPEVSAWVRERGWHASLHMQIECELAFEKLTALSNHVYMRTTSAFAGFPQGPKDFGLLKNFSESMFSTLGVRWSEWGSEQVASNFMVSNQGNAVQLLPPKYVNNSKINDLVGAKLIHFYGTYRFYQNRYEKYALQALEGIRS